MMVCPFGVFASQILSITFISCFSVTETVNHPLRVEIVWRTSASGSSTLPTPTHFFKSRTTNVPVGDSACVGLGGFIGFRVGSYKK